MDRIRSHCSGLHFHRVDALPATHPGADVASVFHDAMVAVVKATEGSVIALANARFGGGAQLHRRARNTWWLSIGFEHTTYPYGSRDDDASTLEQLQAQLILELRSRIALYNSLISDVEAGRCR